jgi:hypothetical protein
VRWLLVHRRSLPIAKPCTAFVPTADSSWCPKCERHVHDLSAMTQTEVRRFLVRHAGRRICVAYRFSPDGTLVLRPEPRPIGMLLVTLGLAACTGYAPQIEHPDEHCRDDAGYEIDCRMAQGTDVRVLPDEAPERDAEIAAADATTTATTNTPDGASPSVGDVPASGDAFVRAVPPLRPRTNATSETRDARAIDRSIRGGIVLGELTDEEASSVPTFELVAEARERRAERREARASRRARRAPR